MVKKKIPDAWDDGWEEQADKAGGAPVTPEPEPEVPLTKAQRIAKHEEENKKLWESADSPQEFHFLNANTTNNAPPSTTTAFKPAMKVLSRKPAPRMIAKRDPVTGMQQMTLQADDDEDEAPRVQLTPQEIRMRQQKQREEKQRLYDEARAKIFGTDTKTKSAPSSGQSTPGTVTPPEGRQGSHNRNNRGGRGRGRGGQRGDGGQGRQDSQSHGRQESQGGRPANQPGNRELFDPGYTPKPGFTMQKRGGGESSTSQPSTPRGEDQIIRTPKGPDGSGRGGFGFAAKRGAREG